MEPKIAVDSFGESMMHMEAFRGMIPGSKPQKLIDSDDACGWN